MSEKSRISRPATIFVFILIVSILNTVIGQIMDSLLNYLTSITAYLIIFTTLEAIAGYIVPLIIESRKFTQSRQGTRYVVYLIIFIVFNIFDFAATPIAQDYSMYPFALLAFIPTIGYVATMFISARVTLNKNWKKEKERISSEQENNIQETAGQHQTIEKQGTE